MNEAEQLSRLLMMHVGSQLDVAIEHIVFRRNITNATRSWSQDERAAHAIYDPVAKNMGWRLLYQTTGKFHGWQVWDAQGNLVAKGESQSILAMVRAVLTYHLQMKFDDGTLPPAMLQKNIVANYERGIMPYATTTSTH
jgi:hypothetical protein